MTPKSADVAQENRPERLVVVTGTGTDVGKTYVSVGIVGAARRAGVRVAVRKPAQSFDPTSVRRTDAERLAAASGEDPSRVCPRKRWYELAMSPPQAAAELGRPAPLVSDLCGELGWPEQQAELGVVELAGGLRSPQAVDGDGMDVIAALNPDVVVMVADAGLGTLNSTILTLGAIEGIRAELGFGICLVVNRFSEVDALHRSNKSWLESHIPRLPIAAVPEAANVASFDQLLTHMLQILELP